MKIIYILSIINCLFVCCKEKQSKSVTNSIDNLLKNKQYR